MTRDLILHVQSLTKVFSSDHRQITVLDNVSFALDRGATCAVLGPSGSGKTTLLSLCAGLDQPTSGGVVVDGLALNEAGEDERARLRRESLGFVFQTFQLIPTLTALENVMVPAELCGRRNARAQALDWLRRVGLADRVHHYPAQLSGGEQQRVGIARAFINRPKLLLADEPTGNLDGETAAGIIDLLFNLNRAEGATLLLVTHDQDLARRCRRELRLRAGRLEKDALNHEPLA